MRVRALKTTAITALLGAAVGALVALAGRWWVARDTTSDFGFYSYTPLRSGDNGLAVHTRLATSWWQLLWPAVGTGLVVAALAAAAMTLGRHGLRPLPRGRRALLSLGAAGLVLGGAVGGALYLRPAPPTRRFTTAATSTTASNPRALTAARCRLRSTRDRPTWRPSSPSAPASVSPPVWSPAACSWFRDERPGQPDRVDTTAKLIDVHVPREPEALVVVLHGGGSREGGVAVSPTQLSVLRMIPIARRVARVARRRLAVFRLLNSARGWDTGHTPADDAAWALDELEARFGRLPAGLIGHSLGGRAALLTAGRPDVRSVVALAPWVTPDDGRQDASGSKILIVHGTADRIASPQRSATVADRLRRTATSLAYVEVDGGKHAMLSKSGVFTSLAASFTGAVLLDPPPKADEFVGELVRGRAEPWRV